MTILTALQKNTDAVKQVDSVGTNFGVVESGLYDAIIKLAYLSTAASGAMGLDLEFETSTGSVIRQKLWMTSGTAKGGNSFYMKDGKKFDLPGFTTAQDLTLLTLGEEIANLPLEDKVIKVYNFQERKEVPTKVQMFTTLLGQPIKLGLIKQIVDKNAKNDAGIYEPTGETREENELDKCFRHRDGLTVAEITAGKTESSFMNTWTTRWEGETKNRAKGLTGAAAGVTAGAPSSTPKKALFS